MVSADNDMRRFLDIFRFLFIKGLYVLDNSVYYTDNI